MNNKFLNQNFFKRLCSNLKKMIIFIKPETGAHNSPLFQIFARNVKNSYLILDRAVTEVQSWCYSLLECQVLVSWSPEFPSWAADRWLASGGTLRCDTEIGDSSRNILFIQF